MPGTPVLHFSGRFRFQSPEYNNEAPNPRVEFDPSLARDDVLALCGCNPACYCEFQFEDVRVTQVTYGDGSTDCESDPVIGQQVALEGLLVDVSPSSINSRLFAAVLSVGDALKGGLVDGDQSSYRLNIRPLGPVEETIAAHHETLVRSLAIAQPEQKSRYFAELGTPTELEIYFQLNRWTTLQTLAPKSELLSGDVYGYLRPKPKETDQSGLRLVNRLLVAHPDLDQSALGEFVTLADRFDIDGSYDFLPDEQLVALRYLDFIPFLDRCRMTPDVQQYPVSMQDDSGSVCAKLGSFQGDLAEMRRCGGLVHLRWSHGAKAEGERLVVEAVKKGQPPLPLMRESEWALQALYPLPPAGYQNDRLWTPLGVVLPSGGSAQVRTQVFRRNRPTACQTVRWIVPVSNGRSPIVACFTQASGTTDAQGVATVTLQAHDFDTYSGKPVFDPVTSTRLTYFPLDRYYGNRVVAEIVNPDRHLSGGVEQASIAVRVLHKFRPEDIPDVPSFDRDIRPLLSCQTRYFPWLHVHDDGTDFNRFLDLDNYDDFSKNVCEILRRLALAESDSDKMPRTRDLPFGGVDLIQKWWDTGMAP